MPPVSEVTGTGSAQPFGQARRRTLWAARTHRQVHIQREREPGIPTSAPESLYYLIFKENDGFIDNFKVDNAFGSALQAGLR